MARLDLRELMLLSLLVATSCRKSEEPERGAAPPPIVSSKPGACANGGGTIKDGESAAFFPRTAGDYCIDPNSDARAYGEGATGTLETVCTELLDGECEVYKAFGLRRVVTARYVDGKGSPGTVNVNLSRFGSSEGAYGFFTKRVVADGDPAEAVPALLEAGGAGALGTGIAYVWRADVVAELSYANELESPDQIRSSSLRVLPELARGLGDKLPGDAKPLPAVALLPAEHRLPMGISYASKDALGVAGVGPGASGYYRDGAQRYRVLALVRADDDSAKDVIGTLRKITGAKPIKDAPFEATALALRDEESSPLVGWVIGRKGSVILGIGDEQFALRAAAGNGDPDAKLSEAQKLQKLKALLEQR
jgi:hypothetical protein